MEKNARILILLICTLCFFNLNAQKKPYYKTEESAVNAAIETFNYELKSGELKEWALENKIKGSYTMDITIGGKKTEVLTVMAIKRSKDGTINQQNSLKSYIKKLRMPFKISKDKSYKFQYEFKF